MDTTNNYNDYDIKPDGHGFLYIGYVVQCNIGDSFGIVGYNQEYVKNTWLYFFQKQDSTNYKRNTIVTFIKDSYEEKQPYEVTCVCPIDNYTILHIDERGQKISRKKRKDGCYHCDLEWNHLIKGIPFIITDESWVTARFPIINDTEKSIYHLKSSFLGYHYLDNIDSSGKRRIPVNLLSCYIESKELYLIGTSSFFEYVSNELEKIKEYIMNFSLNDNLNLYFAGTEGYFKDYPGRDDSFFIIKYWYSFCKDSYLNQLTNLHEEMNYYNCQGRGKDEEDYDVINQEETDQMRKEIKEKYNRDEHYSFLINKLLSDVPSLKERWEYAIHALSNYLTPNDESIVDMVFGDDYIEVIERLNKNNINN